MVGPREVNQGEYLAAYQAYDNDYQAAHALRIGFRRFARWRTDNDLPLKNSWQSNQPAPPRPGPERDEMFARVYHATASDYEAAVECGISPDTFEGWRINNNLESKTPEDRKAPVQRARQSARFFAAYEAGETDGESADMLGVQRMTFAAWRQSLRLPAKTPRKRLTDRDWEDRLAAYEATWSDQQGAARLGLTVHAFQSWRERVGLVAKHNLVEDEEGRIICLSDAEEELIFHYLKGLPIQKIVDLSSLPSQDVKEWFYRRNLPPHGEEQEQAIRLILDLGLMRPVGSNLEHVKIDATWLAHWTQEAPGDSTRSRDEGGPRWDAYRLTWTDQEAAEMLDIPVETFAQWRRLKHLEAKSKVREWNGLPVLRGHIDLKLLRMYVSGLTSEQAHSRDTTIGRQRLGKWATAMGWPASVHRARALDALKAKGFYHVEEGSATHMRLEDMDD